MIYLIAVCISLLAGYFIGLYKERIQWNRLIKNGTIPKPDNK